MYRSIVDYITHALGSPSAAKAFMDEFDDCLDSLRELPEMCPVSRLDGPRQLGYRVALVKNYVLLYRLQEETIYIMHIFHQSQDYAHLVS